MSAVSASPAAKGSPVAGDPVRALQHALYRAAKADPGRRFHALYDKVSRSDVLWRAWVTVRRNNGAPGIDKITLAQVEEYGVTRLLGELAAELKEGRYRPVPARRVYIPKPGVRGEQRPLSIPSVRDQIVQAAVKIVLEPVFEADFLPASFGFRPGRSPRDALQVLIDESWRGRRWVVETDIASCFDACSHCSFCSLWWSEQPVLGGWWFDTQAFPAAGADVDGAEPSVFDTLHDGLAGDAVGEGGFEHGEPAVWGVVGEQRADFGGEADPPGGAGGELLAGDEPVAEPAVQGGGGEAEFGGGVSHGEQFSFLRVVAWLVAGDAQ